MKDTPSVWNGYSGEDSVSAVLGSKYLFQPAGVLTVFKHILVLVHVQSDPITQVTYQTQGRSSWSRSQEMEIPQTWVSTAIWQTGLEWVKGLALFFVFGFFLVLCFGLVWFFFSPVSEFATSQKDLKTESFDQGMMRIMVGHDKMIVRKMQLCSASSRATGIYNSPPFLSEYFKYFSMCAK